MHKTWQAMFNNSFKVTILQEYDALIICKIRSGEGRVSPKMQEYVLVIWAMTSQLSQPIINEYGT